MRRLLSRMYRGETRIDFIGRRRLWFAVSGLFVAASILTLATRGLNYGIEFEGGVTITAPIPDDGPLAGDSDTEAIGEVRDAIGGLGASDATIQVSTEGEDRSISVQTKEIDDPDRQREVISTVAETVGTTVEATDSQQIGSKWGAEITGKALRALLIFLVVILLFISARFEWKMAAAAIVALLHDLIITTGVYSAVGFEVTPATVIAILTILGYSLYDTVVVFDKVEEDTLLASTGRMTYEDAVNLAMNQVFMRSLNTSLSTLLPVGTLLFVGAGLLGAGTLKDLSLALLVGILTGTYSSIFTATPLLTLLKEREPKFRNVREKVLRDAKRSALTPAAAGATTTSDPSESPPRSAPKPAGGTSAPRARAGAKKAKRRKRR